MFFFTVSGGPVGNKAVPTLVICHKPAGVGFSRLIAVMSEATNCTWKTRLLVVRQLSNVGGAWLSKWLTRNGAVVILQVQRYILYVAVTSISRPPRGVVKSLLYCLLSVSNGRCMISRVFTWNSFSRWNCRFPLLLASLVRRWHYTRDLEYTDISPVAYLWGLVCICSSGGFWRRWEFQKFTTVWSRLYTLDSSL